ncbi:B4GALNT2 [Branchiostoma lanceolatum]|uniref:B4GALNT2 protein n=1 Tax=Branchiostoma lanceolatum TaxID=7740 RepID=A0A8J9Z577_BRALA|nr:B4GALNT2 [Branchiostoma lanceolatum]
MVYSRTVRNRIVRSCQKLAHKKDMMCKLLVVVCFGTLLFCYQWYDVTYARDISLMKNARSNRQRMGNRERIENIQRKGTVIWRNRTLSRLQGHTCDCSKSMSNMYTAIDDEERIAFHQRRVKELEKYKKRLEPLQERLYIVKGSVPLSYPVRGLTVTPEGNIEIPGLEVLDSIWRQDYKIQLEASRYGTLDVTAEVSEVHSEGLGEKSLTIRSRSLPNLNHQLQYVVYSNSVYDVGATEIIKFRYLTYEASIPLRIQPPSVPILYDPGPGEDIASKVTVITKTFLRYASIRTLLTTIRAFYPDIRVIVADDSRPIENLQEEHVDHFVMPYAIGWFAGRNLAVSQMITPYLLWVDDYFAFGRRTKLDRLVNVLDNTNLDLVSGKTGHGKVKYTKMTIVPGDKDGDCLLIHDHQHWGQVPGFPRCHFSTRVTNFFMARTDSIRAVGFDPKYARHGHTQFFQAAMGKLKIAACDDVTIGHRRTQTMEYNEFRYPGEEYQRAQRKYEYFKFNIKCHMWFTKECSSNTFFKCNPGDDGFYVFGFKGNTSN